MLRLSQLLLLWFCFLLHSPCELKLPKQKILSHPASRKLLSCELETKLSRSWRSMSTAASRKLHSATQVLSSSRWILREGFQPPWKTSFITSSIRPCPWRFLFRRRDRAEHPRDFLFCSPPMLLPWRRERIRALLRPCWRSADFRCRW